MGLLFINPHKTNIFRQLRRRSAQWAQPVRPANDVARSLLAAPPGLVKALVEVRGCDGAGEGQLMVSSWRIDGGLMVG